MSSDISDMSLEVQVRLYARNAWEAFETLPLTSSHNLPPSTSKANRGIYFYFTLVERD